MTHFRQPENFASPFQQFGAENSWMQAASQDAYSRGAFHPHGRGRQEHSRYLPEVGFQGQEHRHHHHRWEEDEGRHHWRKHHHGQIGRRLGGDDSGGPQNSYNPPADGRAQEYHGRAAGNLTPGQQAFAAEFASKTGLDQNVVGNWLLKEESGRAAQNREAHGNMNWLNIGYTDKGHRGTGNEFWYNDPVKAADISAAWMKGEINVPGFGRASHGIQRIQEAAGQSPQTQMAMIANSGWASSHYGYGQQVAGMYHHHHHNYLANEFASRSHYQPWRYRYERG